MSNRILVILLIIVVVVAIVLPYGYQKVMRNRIARVATQEWQKFGQGTLNENTPQAKAYINQYWMQGANEPAKLSEPWSAVFISYVMKKAGAAQFFTYSARHADYIRSVVQNRLSGSKNPVKAYRITEKPLQVGDLVCFARTSGISYDTDRDYPAHCDVVVSVDKALGQASVIGGNVSNSVSRRTYAINGNGYLTDTTPHAIIKLERLKTLPA